MAKKDFKNLSAQAVDKFFNTTPDTQQEPPAPNTPSTPHAPNTLVTPSTQHTPNTLVTPSTPHAPKRVQPRPRINIAFDEEALTYLQLISRIDNMSITKYLNELIRKDLKDRIQDINKAKEIFK
jgi:DNA topoisomerase VI subunit B